ncbi:DUF2262 domain-containing protein [Sporosarcina sp. Marseille-Q4063]|uniref:DUF2262 domain-containing protein n=1 Tax=Sporosarcina sp. Marseille-Q4063 TaxID=2810514 RepID=UPI001BAFCE22|nr:DUF2262 domain-containing protein [Sporosarcina sp. Marseille-Q4063]QUW21122.1 DUF2262 domain-containing protein [Sporosarcina sp. Marseille-Q4063]
MEKILKSTELGIFVYNEELISYELEIDKVPWSLKMNDQMEKADQLMKRAEVLFKNRHEFNTKVKVSIAEELLDYKNDFWPVYDEDDENLDWDKVDAGEYDTTRERFTEAITLLGIEIKVDNIYLEYDDGDLFGGHRIHVLLDKNGQLLKAEI